MSAHLRPLSRWHWLLPAALLAAGTGAVWLWDLDHAIAALYYSANEPTHWPIGYRQPWSFLYRWGVIPAIALGAAGLLLLARGYWAGRTGSAAGDTRHDARLRAFRRAGLMIVLSLALGPLLTVNGVLHETWGRPRPRQVVEYGGAKEFRPVLFPIRDRKAQSFPTGHAAGGFSLVVLYFVWRESRPRLAWAGLAASLALGSVTAWARIAQGGHWLSDGLWSAGIIWLAAWAVARGMEWRSEVSAGKTRHGGAPQAALGIPPRAIAVALAVAAVLQCAGYLALLPIQERVDRVLALPAGVREVRIEAGGAAREFHTGTGADGRLSITATLSGRGAPWVALADRWEAEPAADGVWRGSYGIAVAGRRQSQNLEVWIGAPAGVQVAVSSAEGSK